MRRMPHSGSGNKGSQNHNAAHMTSSIIIPPVPSIEAAALIIVVMPPVAFCRPSAKTPAQIIKDTVEANTLPMPEKKDFIFSHDFLKLRV